MSLLPPPARIGAGLFPAPATKAVWLALLTAVQFTDVLTSQVGLQAGGVEGDVFSARLLALGGIPFFWLVKSVLLLLSLGVATAVDLAAARLRTPGAAVASAVVFRAVQVCTVLLTLVVAHNAGVIGVQQGWLNGSLASLI